MSARRYTLISVISNESLNKPVGGLLKCECMYGTEKNKEAAVQSYLIINWKTRSLEDFNISTEQDNLK